MFHLPELNYGYGDLSPAISEDIMVLHHQKHHQSYVDHLNDVLKTLPKEFNLSNKNIVQILLSINDFPKDERQTIINNGGGHYNHSLFWQTMSLNPTGFQELSEDNLLKNNLLYKYDSFDDFKNQFSEAAKKLFGSGWVWLSQNLEIISSPNQNNPLIDSGAEPVFGLDVWEHAYYLDYKNVRTDYIDAWWDVVDWKFISERYTKLVAQEN